MMQVSRLCMITCRSACGHQLVDVWRRGLAGRPRVLRRGRHAASTGQRSFLTAPWRCHAGCRCAGFGTCGCRPGSSRVGVRRRDLTLAGLRPPLEEGQLLGSQPLRELLLLSPHLPRSNACLLAHCTTVAGKPTIRACRAH